MGLWQTTWCIQKNNDVRYTWWCSLFLIWKLTFPSQIFVSSNCAIAYGILAYNDRTILPARFGVSLPSIGAITDNHWFRFLNNSWWERCVVVFLQASSNLHLCSTSHSIFLLDSHGQETTSPAFLRSGISLGARVVSILMNLRDASFSCVVSLNTGWPILKVRLHIVV